jgi:hypothetical protein
MGLFDSIDVSCSHLSATLSIDGSRYNASSIACSFATGEETAYGDVL